MSQSARNRLRQVFIPLLAAAAVLAFAPAQPGAGVVVHRVPANLSSLIAGMSADGRYVLLVSWATNLVPGDTDNGPDAFVRDRVKNTTERVSVGAGGEQVTARDASISANGRFVAFVSGLPNVVPGDTNGVEDVFVRDRKAKTTERVSVGPGSSEANDGSTVGSISADGRFVTFSSGASNLVPGDTNSVTDTFVRDRLSRTTERVSVASTGAEANGDSGSGKISGNGRFVAFGSNASNLVAGDANGAHDVFLRDRAAHVTARLAVAGAAPGGTVNLTSMSTDGRYIAVQIQGSGFSEKIYVVGRIDGSTDLVGVTPGPQIPAWAENASLSADGRFVAFDTTLFASGRKAGPTFGQIFLRDRRKKTTERISVNAHGNGGNGLSMAGAVSADGRFVAFQSEASNLGAGAANLCGDEGDQFDCDDVFVRDRVARTTTLMSIGRPQAPPVSRLLLRPWPARAGQALVAAAQAGGGDIVVLKPKLTCAATVAGRPVTASVHSYFDGAARCVWKIPGHAHGKRLKGSLTVATPSGTAVRRFAGTLR